MDIICSKNRGYRWTCERRIYFRGYFQSKKGKTYRDIYAIDKLSEISSYTEFLLFLKEIYGSFSIIIDHENEVWAAVDIARSMPLYYSTDLKYMSDKVDTIMEYKGIDTAYTDKLNVLEMYATSFVSSDRTVLKDIKQIDIGCSICVKESSLSITPYYCHTNKFVNIDRNDAIELLAKTTSSTLQRIKKVICGRPIIISLSGGYDSRYLACSLKENGFGNVICYTYGKKDSFEPKQSKKVAEALGFEWHCVYYDDIPRDMLVGDAIQDYYNYTRNYDYISYIQNYYAFKKLVEDNLIPENAVVLTGLCNDMPTGFYTPDKTIVNQYGYSVKGCAEYIYDNLFVKFKLSDFAKSIYIQRIENDIKARNLEVFDYESFIKVSDCVTTGYNHSRCFLHMNDVHEYFGHEWLIPCWDKDLLSFWYSMPAEYRIKQNLYETYITDYIGKKYGVGTKKYIRAVAKTENMQKLIRNVGSLIVKPALSLGIPLKRKTDINNFAPQEVSIYKSLKNKKAIKPKHAALALMLTVYFLDYRHGSDWYKQIKDDVIE